MGARIRAFRDVYRRRILERLAALPLHTQLREISGSAILLVDCCGLSYRFARTFWQAGARIVVLERNWEAELKGLRDELAAYDFVYAMVAEEQEPAIDFEAIRIIFYRNTIIRTACLW
ncbi:hypothetical protein PAPHI01_0721 [Pancytospora philotis]|nr:hypothetical protein PAPHI01_0721 [Pancytospora philotis]